MADCFDTAYTIRCDIKDIVVYSTSMRMLTITILESLFKIIVKSRTNTEERLMIDVRATQKVFANSDISDIGWVRSDEDIVEGLTKTGRIKALKELIKKAILTTKVEQCIYRKEKGDLEKRTHHIRDTTHINKERMLRM